MNCADWTYHECARIDGCVDTERTASDIGCLSQGPRRIGERRPVRLVLNCIFIQSISHMQAIRWCLRQGVDITVISPLWITVARCNILTLLKRCLDHCDAPSIRMLQRAIWMSRKRRTVAHLPKAALYVNQCYMILFAGTVRTLKVARYHAVLYRRLFGNNRTDDRQEPFPGQ